ncbi:hypothetical protein DN752_15310 [Echinicola strongylocentroti]|uniref:Gylcosyl hydrolase 115 C-terminal domain-containing protein n=1 Tax=Echinicola strongylocentroti TaxID=1795355 RepID=A0A2Z4ILD0_9BACT|nr:glycosyl hydrolase 115 family protein [Echinicola strongylocentroti]AWW31378.1 hypothetical protein DN752_15310 [Echinicola strongylocentroti]
MNISIHTFLFALLANLFFVQSEVFARQSNDVVSRHAGAGRFPLAADVATALVVDDEVEKSVLIATENFQKDVHAVTGQSPDLLEKEDLAGHSHVVVIGVVGKSQIINALEKSGKLDVSMIKGQWEVFHRQVVQQPFPGIDEALVIAGSDPRGAVFGVYELSEQIGVSPWNWWADVPVKPLEELYISTEPFTSAEPSVKYRGVFLNDEDWGLQPWAAKTFEPEIGDIGPKTYAKIFELLLRLKANFIWPAMHPSTKAFFHYPGNAEMAKNYGVVIGTSHAEPMLRNNVDEWDHDVLGDFNYTTNRDQVYNYWDQRVEESQGIDAVYTVGMRGVHDSGMEGAGSTEEAAQLLEKVIQDQRGMLEKHIASDAAVVPQAFTAYKEVLGIYDAGLDLPDDITLVWPDDNYGYIRRLSDADERQRAGGSGVYYHASYWGRPHDYLWLSSTHPALIREEMMKAYRLDARDIWVLNVGDIKPLEYNIQLFMDMAYAVRPFEQPAYVKDHLTAWYKGIFGEQGKTIAEVKWKYYQLAFERRPEFMGWSQTEPTTPVFESAYSPFVAGDEVEKRIGAYQAMEEELQEIKSTMDEEHFPAFYQLAFYPVRGASLMNQKFLYRQKALSYQKEGRLSAADYAALSHAAYDEIVEETAFYNQQLLDGKWNHMMDHAPRRLPVYQDPEIALAKRKPTKHSVGISLERGAMARDKLPVFNNATKRKYFFDLFLKNESEASWEVVSKPDYILLNQSSGVLAPTGQKETRIWVEVDWSKVAPSGSKVNGEIHLEVDGQAESVLVELNNMKEAKGVKFVNDNGQVIIYAENYSHKNTHDQLSWQLIEGLGHSGAVMGTSPLKQASAKGDFEAQASLIYEFYMDERTDKVSIDFQCLPSHPLTKENGLRLGYSVNGGAVQVLDFETHGRSEEWKQNVLRNAAIKTAEGISLKKGLNTLKVFWVDPGLLLDVISVKTGSSLKEGYGLLPETKK